MSQDSLLRTSYHVYVKICFCVLLGGKRENREVVVATEDFVSAMPEHLSFSEVCERLRVMQ